MFVVMLKFSSNRARAGEWMAAHKAWLQKGYDEGKVVASGSLQDAQGGCILVQGDDRLALDQLLSEDPFVVNDVVRAEIVEFALSKADPRLGFLLPAQGG
ncbi:MAG TPA: YciI family protein [Aquabacterium sp.]|nr:YciI family protein [Aquabacterium sp.]